MNLRDIAFITLFWSSFAVIGNVFYQFLIQLRSNALKHEKENKYENSSLFKLFISFCLGFAVLSIPALVGSLLELPISYFVITWTVILLLSVGYFGVKWRPNIPKSISPLSAILIIALLLDYLISIKLGGYLGLDSDAWMHLSKITSISEGTMGFHDSHFSNLVDPRYVINVMHVFMASCASLVDRSALVVWDYSSAFFRTIAFLSVYTIACIITKKSGVISKLTTIVSILILSFDLRLAIYPNKIVTSFYVFYIYSLIKILEKPKLITESFYLLSCMLIALTHGPFALGVFMVNTITLTLLLVRLFLSRGKNTNQAKNSIKFLLGGSLILSIMPLTSLIIPENRDLIIHGEDILHVLGINILSFDYLYTPFILLSLLLIFYWMIYRSKISKKTLLVSLVAISIFPLIAFTPLLFDFTRNFIPVQLIKRFSGLNFFGRVIVSGLPLFLAAKMIDERLKVFKSLPIKIRRFTPEFLYKRTVTILVLIFLLVSGAGEYHKYYIAQQATNSSGNKLAESLLKITKDIDFNNSIVVANEDVGYSLAAIGDIELVNSLFGHSAPSSNYQARKACLDDLLSNDEITRSRALYEVRPKYYFVSKSDELYEKIQFEEGFNKLNKGMESEYSLYEVDKKYITLTAIDLPTNSNCNNYSAID